MMVRQKKTLNNRWNFNCLESFKKVIPRGKKTNVQTDNKNISTIKFYPKQYNCRIARITDLGVL